MLNSYVRLCARHHADGIPWTSLAVAVGVAASTLQRWRHSHGPGRKDRGAIHFAAMAIAAVPETPPSAGPAERRVLFTAGHPKPGGNDFATEAAIIRGRITLAGIDFREHSCVEIGELPTLLARLRPAVLQLTAHATFEGVHLALDGAPYAADPLTLTRVLATAPHRPHLVVLNFCDSAHAARQLATAIPSVIAWAGSVDDTKAARFSGQLYRRLADGAATGASFEAAHLTVGAMWPGIRPVLAGSSLFTPLA